MTRTNHQFPKSMNTQTLAALAAALALMALNQAAHAQGTAFIYQGRLDSDGTPYTGNAEIQATLWDAASGGSQIAANSPEQVIVGVTNGLFVLPLDFGANFPGTERWLQLAVRTSVSPFTTLTPRQPLTAAPYAITASNLSGVLPAVQLSGPIASANLAGTYSGVVTLNNAANSFTGNGAGLTALNASQLTSGTVPNARLAANVARTNQVWLLGGNAGTTPGAQFLGTTDNQALEFQVNQQRALRLEPNASGAPNLVGGSPWNWVGAGVVGATIGGGGATNYVAVSSSVYTNRVEADFGTVSGGVGNTIQSVARYATIGGGVANMIQTDAQYATIGGGAGNTIQREVDNATIGGGYINTIQRGAFGATIAGGWQNLVQTNAQFATIGGGNQNSIQTNAQYATIPGGRQNSATNYAFAAGHRAKANHQGAFVWADSTDANFASDRANQFKVRAGGGVHLVTGGSGLNPAGLRVEPTTANAVGVYIFQTSSDAALVVENRGTGVNSDQIKAFNGPGNQVFRVDNDGDVFAKSFTPSSDRHRKENFEPICPQEMLAKVAALPITRWNFKGDAATPHVGPMAQDFHAAFGLGANDTTIATVDADGVALAAIQGLNQKLEQKETEITELKRYNQSLEQRLAALERVVCSQTAK